MWTNSVQWFKRYGLGREAIAAEQAVSTIKASGKYVLEHEKPGGFVCIRPFPHGRGGAMVGLHCETEADAWLTAAIRLAVYKPGSLVMTSREFGSSWTANGEARRRLEIRKVGASYEVFFLVRSYLRGREAKDTHQQPEMRSFETVGLAAEYVFQFMTDYSGAAADDKAAALEAHREREHESACQP